MNLLLSFLGTGRLTREGERVQGRGKYEVAKYKFSNNQIIETSMFSEALKKIYNIDYSIIIGTYGSMWDELFLYLYENEIEENREYEEFWSNLSEQILKNRNNKNPKLEESIKEKLINYLKEKKVYAVILGQPLLNKTQQKEFYYNLSQILNDIILQNSVDKIYVDITHSFRHFPTISLPIILIFKNAIKKIKEIEFIYGIYEYRDENNITPVVKLPIFEDIINQMVAVDKLLNYNDASLFIEEVKKDNKNNNTSKIDEFSKSINLGLMDLVIRNYSRILNLNLNVNSKILEFAFNEFKNRFNFLSNVNENIYNIEKIRATLKLIEVYLNTFKVGEVVILLSQLIDNLRNNNMYLEVINTNINNIGLRNQLLDIITNYIPKNTRIERLIDLIRNKIAHPELLDNNGNYTKEELELINNLSSSQIVEIIESTLNYLNNNLQ